ncbi:MAG: hypothetical protein HQL35_10530 [Alphaproteobacteria bacterium]|nr:hypothetical protein [Alphaproteobacteria bacterium]
MFDQQTTFDSAAQDAPGSPTPDKRERRRESLCSNRPDAQALPMGWIFVGARAMPRSEHLIPFLI